MKNKEFELRKLLQTWMFRNDASKNEARLRFGITYYIIKKVINSEPINDESYKLLYDQLVKEVW